jgi:signal transduction histidine kinase
MTQEDQDIQSLMAVPQKTPWLKAIFETIADGIILYDRNKKLLLANTASREILGFDVKPELFSMTAVERGTFLNVCNIYGQPLPVEQWPHIRILHGEVLSGNTAMDTLVTSPEGNNRYVNVAGAPIRDKDGQQVGAVVILRDVTERCRGELRTTHTLSALLKMAESLVQFSDLEGQEEAFVSRQRVVHQLLELVCETLESQVAGIVTFEDERFQPVAAIGASTQMFHFFWQVLPGTSLYDYFDEEQQACLLAGEVVVLTGDLYGMSQALIAPMLLGGRLLGLIGVGYADGEPSYPLLEAMTLCNAVSKLAGLVIERERLILERTKAQTNALAEHEANRQKDTFLSMAGHELRTPLTTIKGSIQLVRRKLKQVHDLRVLEETMSRVEELLERAERQVAVEDRLVGDLLDVSRLQENRLALRLKCCNLVDIVLRVIGDIQAGNPSRCIRLQLSASKDVPVDVDVDRIGQVLTNYLTNAIRYSPSEQPIEVHVEVKEQLARVAVCDRGPGLNDLEQQQIWKCFYQLPRRIVYNSSPGMGLGLYICQMIIKQHQGEVGVESSPGKGSTFWFTLALSQQSFSSSSV